MKRNFDIFLPMILKLNQSFQEMGQLWLEESVFSEKKKKKKERKQSPSTTITLQTIYPDWKIFI